MASLIIVKPAALTGISGSTGFARTLTPDPKEAMILASGAQGIVNIDAGAAVTADSFLCGYHGGEAGSLWSVQAFTDATFSTVLATPVSGSAVALGYGPPYHSFALTSPVTARYWRLTYTAGSGASYVGVFALGAAFKTTWGTEWGAGRAIEDTGTAERLFGGGFGIDDGAVAGGYQWTFGDLQANELRILYQLVKDRRTTRSVLVVEDPDQTDGLTERVHWGLLRKLDTYERLDPQNTKWSLQIADWA